MAENNLDGVARQLRVPGGQQANAEELLAELVRLVDSSGPALEHSQPLAGTVSEPTRTTMEPMKRDAEQPRAPKSDNSYSNDPTKDGPAGRRRAGVAKFVVSALVLGGMAVLGSIFWLKRAEPGLPNASPILATTPGPTTTEPGTNLTVSTSSEAGTTTKDVAQPAPGKVASPEDQPRGVNARVPLNNPPQSDLAPTAIGVAQPTAGASAAKPLAASGNASAVEAPIAAAPPTAPQPVDPKPAPAVSLPPDSTRIATPSPSTIDQGAATHSTDAPLPPIRPAAKAKIEAAFAQRSTAKLDLPTKLSNKSDARVVGAKADATGAKGPAERSALPQREASLKSEKEAKSPNAAQAPTEGQAVPPAPPPAAAQHNTNPVVHAFTNMVGAVAGFIPFVPH